MTRTFLSGFHSENLENLGHYAIVLIDFRFVSFSSRRRRCCSPGNESLGRGKKVTALQKYSASDRRCTIDGCIALHNELCHTSRFGSQVISIYRATCALLTQNLKNASTLFSFLSERWSREATGCWSHAYPSFYETICQIANKQRELLHKNFFRRREWFFRTEWNKYNLDLYQNKILPAPWMNVLISNSLSEIKILFLNCNKLERSGEPRGCLSKLLQSHWVKNVWCRRRTDYLKNNIFFILYKCDNRLFFCRRVQRNSPWHQRGIQSWRIGRHYGTLRRRKVNLVERTGWLYVSQL